MIELPHFIGGQRVKGASGRFVEGFEPMTGKAISRVPLASREEARAAVANAAARSRPGPRPIRSAAPVS